jgi:hypothetical protein
MAMSVYRMVLISAKAAHWRSNRKESLSQRLQKYI